MQPPMSVSVIWFPESQVDAELYEEVRTLQGELEHGSGVMSSPEW